MSNSFLDRMKHMILSSKPSESSDSIILNTAPVQSPHIVDVSAEQGYLTGQLLVATPLITTGCFHKSVVYIFAHNADGAMGIIVNQPLELTNFSSLVEGFNLPDGAVNKEMPVYYGGPVDRARGFVLHTTDYRTEHTIARDSDVGVTASAAILDDVMMGKGPRKAALIVGYAGWSAGQLEQEIEQNSWINVPSSAKIVFDTEHDMKWVTASKSLGVDMNFYSTAVGHA
jgi:putative transcriptional regulator